MQSEPHPPFTEQTTLSSEPTDKPPYPDLNQPSPALPALLCHKSRSHHTTPPRVSSVQTLPPSSVRSRSYSQCRPGNSVADGELAFWVRGRTDREWEGGYDVDVLEELGEIADVRCGAPVCIVEMRIWFGHYLGLRNWVGHTYPSGFGSQSNWFVGKHRIAHEQVVLVKTVFHLISSHSCVS